MRMFKNPSEICTVSGCSLDAIWYLKRTNNERQVLPNCKKIENKNMRIRKMFYGIVE